MSGLDEFALSVEPAALTPTSLAEMGPDDAEGTLTEMFDGIASYLRMLAIETDRPILPFDEPDITGAPPGTVVWWIDTGADTLNAKVMYPDGATVKAVQLPVF